MQRWRLIDTDLAHPYYVTALDDAISMSVSEGISPNTLHFYRRSPPGVSVGRFQSVKEINMEECRKKGVIVVRRKSGGGTIFTDEGCLIYALIFKSGLIKPEEIFDKVCKSIVSSLRKFGFNASYKQPNDVLVNGKKVSGSALLMKENVILIHGTIMSYTDIETMNKILLKRKKIEVTTLEREGKKIEINDLKRSLIEEFEKSLGIKTEKGEINEYEKYIAEKLVEERYGRDEWNFSR